MYSLTQMWLPEVGANLYRDNDSIRRHLADFDDDGYQTLINNLQTFYRQNARNVGEDDDAIQEAINSIDWDCCESWAVAALKDMLNLESNSDSEYEAQSDSDDPQPIC